MISSLDWLCLLAGIIGVITYIYGQCALWKTKVYLKQAEKIYQLRIASSKNICKLSTENDQPYRSEHDFDYVHSPCSG